MQKACVLKNHKGIILIVIVQQPFHMKQHKLDILAYYQIADMILIVIEIIVIQYSNTVEHVKRKYCGWVQEQLDAKASNNSLRMKWGFYNKNPPLLGIHVYEEHAPHIQYAASSGLQTGICCIQLNEFGS